MNTQAKTGLAALALLGTVAVFGIAQDARADFWTKFTRDGSGGALPAKFELENMVKSSDNVRFFYGNDRVNMADQNSFVRHIVSFDGNNWSDQTSAAETAGGYGDIEFLNMYADPNGNVWMPNRKDPNVPLLKYNSASGWTKISASTIAHDAFPSGPPTKMLIKNLFGNPSNTDIMYAIANGEDRLYLLVYVVSENKWYDSGIDGGALTAADKGTDVWGIYDQPDNSFWIYQYHSSENEYANPQGGDQGIGIYRYKDGSWTHYDSNTAISDGNHFINGITQAFADSSGNIWVGSRHGVFKFDGSNWVNWTKSNSNIFTNRIQRIQQDADGRIWIVALAEENSTDPNNRGGISIYTPSNQNWDYYTSYNGEDALDNATNIFMLGAGGDEIWMFTGHGEIAMAAGIYQLTRDSAHTAIYGQTSGTTVTKASLLDAAKKKIKSSSKKVTIYKLKKVKKKWKKSTRVYSSGSYKQWYKALSLDVGRYRVESKVKGKKKKVRTITVSSGDPYRLDLK